MRISRLNWILIVVIVILIVTVAVLSINIVEQSITIKNLLPPP